jgi:DNA polymerase III subunit alpha
VNNESEILFGLGAIKGTGETAVEAIIGERGKNGPFKSIFDFAERVNLRAVNKKTFESLALSGAFDCFNDYHRKQYVYAGEGDVSLIEKAIKYGNMIQSEKNSAQTSLFGSTSNVSIPPPKVEPIEPFGDIEKLRLEKEVVGFYISGHPLDQFKVDIKNFCTCSVDKIEEHKNETISVAGIVSKSVSRQTKTGKMFGLFTIDDYEGSLDMAMFGEEYLKHQHLLGIGQYVFVSGKVVERYNQIGAWELRPTTVQLLADVREKMSKTLSLDIHLDDVNESLIHALEELSASYPGKVNLLINVLFKEENLRVDLMSRKFKVSPENNLLDELNKMPEVEFRLLP